MMILLAEEALELEVKDNFVDTGTQLTHSLWHVTGACHIFATQLLLTHYLIMKNMLPMVDKISEPT